MNNGSRQGFTLIEVLVSMLIVSIVAAGAMALLSSSIRLTSKAREKKVEWALLEAAAQAVLAKPWLALEENLEVDSGGASEVVQVASAAVTYDDYGDIQPPNSTLYRVTLSKDADRLTLSVLVPDSRPGEGDFPDIRDISPEGGIPGELLEDVPELQELLREQD